MRTGHAHRVDDCVAIDHFFEVPLDHAVARSQLIELYAREVSHVDGMHRPWLVFLQGGPGGKAPRPNGTIGWLKAAVQHFRVLLLDQRGTGRSTPANRQTLVSIGTPAEQAEYLSNFRADSIIKDCELIRRELLGDAGRWSVLGQSFGGFCATTYLSQAPEFLDRVLITGGLPPLDGGADKVYRATYPKVISRNAEYYTRYPEDAPLLNGIRDHIAENRTLLPNGDLLTPERLQFIGLLLGTSTGYHDIHHLVEEAWSIPGQLSDTFLTRVLELTSLAVNPLFAILHEPGYCQLEASAWSACRILDEFPSLTPAHSQFNFTGEMIYPWMFEQYSSLRPLREAAERLAARDDWPVLYDSQVLRSNDVPVAAAIYYDDLYVAQEFSIETARAIRGARSWVTNEYEHDGLRLHGEVIFDRLLEMSQLRSG